jgi:HEAT repeat protein
VKALAIKVGAGDTNAVEVLRGTGVEAVPTLVELLDSQEGFWRRQARALATKLPRRFEQPLLKWAGPSTASRLRVAGAKSLGALGPLAESAVPALLKRLHDPESYIGLEAADALARIGPASVPGLTLALSDDAPRVRQAAAFALGQAGASAEPAIPRLIERLADPDQSVRTSSAYSLSLIGNPTLVALSNVIDHAEPAAREAAVKEFIAFYRSLRSIEPPLIKMARAVQPDSRFQAIRALGLMRVADDASVRAFIEALQDPVPEVRLAALNALNSVPGRATVAVSNLVVCLRDPSPPVRELAARVLGAVGSPANPALSELTNCVKGNQGAVRAAAQDAIEKIAPARRSDSDAELVR